jgi:poly-gamma-glutamate capsule biosynthesis protein CapA/YwtB (metallophosphatase superfamily)
LNSRNPRSQAACAPSRAQFNPREQQERQISAGRGAQLTFTNLATGATIALRSNGAVEHKVFNADGSQTVTDTGRNVLILFPTDTPAEPSTTLIVGRLVFTIDPAGNFTVLSTSGKTTDICAALS